MAESQPKPASQLALSSQGADLLKSVEALHLKPYDDQTGRDITAWCEGATIGYGHLIKQSEWPTYAGGFGLAEAQALFDKDQAPFAESVRKVIKVPLLQNQFDALVILAFNIGDQLNSSSAARLINDPKAQTPYANLESAWKAFNISQGKVMQGLNNRRACEWNIYSKGIYARW
jgi:GH24 family phage-related lysozyme (muramidase)